MNEDTSEPIVAGESAEDLPIATPAPEPPGIEDLLAPAELAAVHAARAKAITEASTAGAPHGMREVVGLLALHNLVATVLDGALRIDIAPMELRVAADKVVRALAARGVQFVAITDDGPHIEGWYDVMAEEARLLVSGVDDAAIGGD